MVTDNQYKIVKTFKIMNRYDNIFACGINWFIGWEENNL
jgi:hypothetical protein